MASAGLQSQQSGGERLWYFHHIQKIIKSLSECADMLIDVYDLWDLGEFNQKGSQATKWGAREDLAELMLMARVMNMHVIWDAVLNHKTAGDATEPCWAVEVDPTGEPIICVKLQSDILRPLSSHLWLIISDKQTGGRRSRLPESSNHGSNTTFLDVEIHIAHSSGIANTSTAQTGTREGRERLSSRS